jgi:hypothetical protein
VPSERCASLSKPDSEEDNRNVKGIDICHVPLHCENPCCEEYPPSGRCRGVGRGRRSVPAAHDGEPGEGDGDADIVIRIKVDAPVLKRTGAGEPSAQVARPKSSELERTGGGPAAVLRNLVEDMPA